MMSIRRVAFVACVALAAISLSLCAQELTLPLKSSSVRFAVIGDMGTGEKPQYEVAEQMIRNRQKFPFEFVIALGDDLYGGSSPSDYENQFERPYKLLLDAGVNFYAVLGNHDSPNERFYKPFNMNGQKYYTYKKSNVRFFALDSNYMNPQQLSWLEKELQNSGSEWKICYFHHPLYSSGAFHGPSTELRVLLEPLFVKYGVQVVFAGHEHVYERVKPQNGIYYFTEGASGSLRKGNLRKTDLTAAGYDQDRSFMLVEIAGDELYFQTISRTGLTVDSGVIPRMAKIAGAASWPDGCENHRRLTNPKKNNQPQITTLGMSKSLQPNTAKRKLAENRETRETGYGDYADVQPIKSLSPSENRSNPYWLVLSACPKWRGASAIGLVSTGIHPSPCRGERRNCKT